MSIDEVPAVGPFLSSVKWLNIPVPVPLSWYILREKNFLVKVKSIITQNEG